MKLVINDCFGGFGLSMKAIKRLGELKGKQVYFYDYDYNIAKDAIEAEEQAEKLIPLTEKNKHDGYYSVFTVPDAHKMTAEEREQFWWYADDTRRDDPELVKVVEELGEEANGSCAELKVVEIPDGTAWEISEYDGIETVEEVHRRWR